MTSTASGRTRPIAALIAGLALGGGTACAPEPAAPEEGPRLILVDEYHNNGHTLAGTYADLGEALEEEGFIVRGTEGPLRGSLLDSASLLITANALADVNVEDWTLPTPSAFGAEEVATVRDWVVGGGSLLLVADHMPFPGAASTLAAAFEVAVSNGFAFDTLQLDVPRPCLLPGEVHVFRRSDGTLADHPVTNGRTPADRVDSVATFTGHAFDPHGTLDPILSFGATAVSIEGEEAWVFDRGATVVPVAGWLQGGVRELGAGRMAMLGEAAMFTTQECWNDGERAMGWQLPAAEQNRLLLVNLVRWLTKSL